MYHDDGDGSGRPKFKTAFSPGDSTNRLLAASSLRDEVDSTPREILNDLPNLFELFTGNKVLGRNEIITKLSQAALALKTFSDEIPESHSRLSTNPYLIFTVKKSESGVQVLCIEDPRADDFHKRLEVEILPSGEIKNISYNHGDHLALILDQEDTKLRWALPPQNLAAIPDSFTQLRRLGLLLGKLEQVVSRKEGLLSEKFFIRDLEPLAKDVVAHLVLSGLHDNAIGFPGLTYKFYSNADHTYSVEINSEFDSNLNTKFEVEAYPDKDALRRLSFQRGSTVVSYNRDKDRKPLVKH